MFNRKQKLSSFGRYALFIDLNPLIIVEGIPVAADALVELKGGI